jgi:hypothetical protein
LLDVTEQDGKRVLAAVPTRKDGLYKENEQGNARL